MLARLATELDLAPDDLEVAFASDHGPAFVQMYAIRAAGHSADEILAALALVAYPDARDTTTLSRRPFGTRTVAVISDPVEAVQWGTLYCIVDGQILIVAQAFEQAVADAAFQEISTGSPRDY